MSDSSWRRSGKLFWEQISWLGEKSSAQASGNRFRVGVWVPPRWGSASLHLLLEKTFGPPLTLSVEDDLEAISILFHPVNNYGAMQPYVSRHPGCVGKSPKGVRHGACHHGWRF